MKPITDMTLGEIEFLVHVHEWTNENERRLMFIELGLIKSKLEMICQRAKLSRVEPPCDCHYCEETRTKEPKKKLAPVHFSLD